MVAKALLTIEGVGMHLYPEFTLQPALEEAAKGGPPPDAPENLVKQFSTVGIDYLELLRDMPADVSGVTRSCAPGR